jgi:hypothetical protein
VAVPGAAPCLTSGSADAVRRVLARISATG